MPHRPSEDELLKRIAGLAEEVGDPNEQFSANAQLAIAAAAKGDWKALDQMIARAKSRREPLSLYMVGTALSGVASQALQTGQLRDALEPLERAEAVYREAGTINDEEYWGLQLWAMCERAGALVKLGREGEALVVFQSIEALCRAHASAPPGLFHALGSQIRILRKRGESRAALDACLRLERDSEGAGNRDELAYALECRALVILGAHDTNTLEDWQTAAEVLRRGVALNRELHDRDREYTAVRNLAMPLTKLGRWEEAMTTLEDSIDLAQELGDSDWTTKGRLFQRKILLECAHDPTRAAKVANIARQAAERKELVDFVTEIDQFLAFVTSKR